MKEEKEENEENDEKEEKERRRESVFMILKIKGFI